MEKEFSVLLKFDGKFAVKLCILCERLLLLLAAAGASELLLLKLILRKLSILRFSFQLFLIANFCAATIKI